MARKVGRRQHARRKVGSDNQIDPFEGFMHGLHPETAQTVDLNKVYGGDKPDRSETVRPGWVFLPDHIIVAVRQCQLFKRGGRFGQQLLGQEGGWQIRELELDPSGAEPHGFVEGGKLNIARILTPGVIEADPKAGKVRGWLVGKAGADRARIVGIVSIYGGHDIAKVGNAARHRADLVE